MRLLPLLAFLMLAAVAIGAAATIQPRPTPADRPVDVFAELEGGWTGHFIGLDPAGRELYRIKVRQDYQIINDTTQRVRVRDEMPDGTVITGEGENTAQRGPDGTLTLRCVVRKSNGETVRHDGRVIQGVDGHSELVWYSRSESRTETFRESVRTEGTRRIYEINGMGIYDGSPMLMHGRYVREQAPSDD